MIPPGTRLPKGLSPSTRPSTRSMRQASNSFRPATHRPGYRCIRARRRRLGDLATAARPSQRLRPRHSGRAGDRRLPDSLLIESLVVIVAAACAVGLARRIGLPPIVGYLVAGRAIGPHGLEPLAPSEGTAFLSELGVVLLMFMIGLEFELPKMIGARATVFGAGGLQVGLTTLIGATAAISLAPRPGRPRSSSAAWSPCRRPRSPSSNCRRIASSAASTAGWRSASCCSRIWRRCRSRPGGRRAGPGP